MKALKVKAARATTAPAASTEARNARLRDVLHAYRRKMDDNVRERLRDRGQSDGPQGAQDVVDIADATLQQEIDVALLKMRVATVSRIDEAIGRLDAGQYGSCFECDGTISELRLRALPFAVRCRDCEQKREEAHGQAQVAAQRAHAPFSHVTG